MSRNARFVSAAKGLLAVQVAGCVGAAAVTGWAAFEVRDMVRERDALAARVTQLEAVIPPQLLPPPPTAIETEAPPPPPDEAQPPDESDPVVNEGGGGPNGPPSPTVECELRDAPGGMSRCPDPLVPDSNGVCRDVRGRRAVCVRPDLETGPCRLADDRRTPSRCALPIVRDATGACRDLQGRRAVCPDMPSPETGPCRLADDRRTPSRCVLPIVPDASGTCRDVEGRPAVCPGVPPPPPCQTVQRERIECVPPFQRTRVPGVCLDGNERLVRCPRGTPREQRGDEAQQQQPARRR